jgi:ubiquinone/menaquinone biosynthesis C-methylase UbiE
MDKKYAEYLLNKTREDYNLIADHFSRTRATVPEDKSVPTEHNKAGEKVLDLGCGNGALWNILKDKRIDYLGVDFSEELIEIAKKNNPGTKFQAADALNLPFSENTFDKIYCIGVLQHIPSKELQLQFLKEAKRVLKADGIMILRVWDFWKRKKGLFLILKYGVLKILGRSQFDFKDIFYPWKNQEGKVIIQRYFHCFTKKELNKLFLKTGFKIEKSWIVGKGKLSNIYIIAKK